MGHQEYLITGFKGLVDKLQVPEKQSSRIKDEVETGNGENRKFIPSSIVSVDVRVVAEITGATRKRLDGQICLRNPIVERLHTIGVHLIAYLNDVNKTLI